MPILAENKHRYPASWRGIRAAILERAGHRCEKCGIPNHAWRNKVTGEWAHDAGMVEAWWLDGDAIARVVLTIAHLDHTPENCDPANLAALCQRCHLAHDAEQHRQTAYATRRRGKAMKDLFDRA